MEILAAIIGAVATIVAVYLAKGGKKPFCPSSVISENWNLMDEELQNALLLAANVSLKRGKDRISTERLFQAFVSISPKRLSGLFELFPEGALPDADPTVENSDENALRKIGGLSTCVNNAFANLGPSASRNERLSPEDIFVEIARNGNNDSVRRLRTHGIDQSKLEALLKQLGWSTTFPSTANREQDVDRKPDHVAS
jgi:hypothetical protein